MQIGSFISTEEESGGGNVIPGDTMMEDGMEGAMGHFRVMESLGYAFALGCEVISF
jgi:hypothetical protein